MTYEELYARLNEILASPYEDGTGRPGDRAAALFEPDGHLQRMSYRVAVEAILDASLAKVDPFLTRRDDEARRREMFALAVPAILTLLRPDLKKATP